MCISGCLCVGVSGVIFSVLQITEVVERLIMAEKRNHKEKMAESRRKHKKKLAMWSPFLRMCRAPEQRCATQGTGDGVHVPEGEPKSKRGWQGLLYTGVFFF